MDLYAYSQIDNFSKLAELNGISVPRLRGYRLMSEEEQLTKEEIRNWISKAAADAAENVIRSWPGKGYIEYSMRTNRKVRWFMILDGNRLPVAVRWDRVHGKLRRRIKFEAKNAKKRVLKNAEVYNRYAGHDDVLYIHARLGGSNWFCYEGARIAKEPWFLEKVDDPFDRTYCDIYAKVTKHILQNG